MMYGKDTCGYDSCPCRGVNFISGPPPDYCVDGTRIKIRDGRPVNGTPEQLETLRLGLLDKYASYLKWRVSYLKKTDFEVEHTGIELWGLN